MARKARVYSPSGYSHVIVKGIGGMVLFEASEDYAFFLNRMKEYSEETKLCICAYCLMNNHVHLLVYDADKSLPLFFKKICVSYSWYFNHKHGRTGHVFQDRYKSFEINDNAYLITVFRYILNNPVKAGISKASEYRWSSYRDYVTESGFTDSRLIKALLGEELDLDIFLHMPDKESDKAEMEYEAPMRDDAWAVVTAKALLGIDELSAVKHFEKNVKQKAVRTMRTAGITISQISRMTGIARRTIRAYLGD